MYGSSSGYTFFPTLQPFIKISLEIIIYIPYNLLIYLKYTITLSLVCLQRCASNNTVNFRTFSSPPKETSLSQWGHSFSSVQSLSRVWLCDSMDCSTPGFPVHHQLPEFTQTHVHWVGDAIQPYLPLSFPLPTAFNLSQHGVFSSESALCIRWPKYWSFSLSISSSNVYSGLISFRID